jgi:hypothetical protein
VSETIYQEKGVLKGWEPFPGAQAEALSRSEFEVGMGGARGGAKTETQIAWFSEPEYLENRGYRALCVRKNADDLFDWVERSKIFFGDSARCSGNPPVFRFKAGGYLRTGHLKDENAYDKYQGHEYQKIGVEELTQIPDEKRYLKLISSCRSVSTPELKPQIFSTWNWGGVGHAWVKKRFDDCCRLKTYVDPVSKRSRIFIPSSVDDNPALLANDPGYVTFLESLPEPVRSAWRFGKSDLALGTFFLNFDPDRLGEKEYIIPVDLLKDKLFLSFDYGWGYEGYSSSGLWWVDPNNIPHRLFTWYRKGMTPDKQADDLYERIESFRYINGRFPSKFIYDYSMDKKSEDGDFTAIDHFKKKFEKHEVLFIPANKAREQGWDVVRYFFEREMDTGLSRMRYWSKFNGTFEENFPLMQTDPNNGGDIQKCPLDHVCDETRYFLVWFMSSFGNLDVHKIFEPPKRQLGDYFVEDFFRAFKPISLA